MQRRSEFIKPPAGNAEERLRFAARAREVMAECNRVLMRASEEPQLLQDMCRIAAEKGGYRMAWVGLVRHDDASTVEPVASTGDDSNYLASIRISWADNEFGQGPAGRAVRSGKPQTVRDISGTHPGFFRWRDVALAHGYRAAATFPLIGEGETFGVFGVHDDEPQAFESEEVALLEQLASDIAYGIGNLRRRDAQQRAEEELQQSEARFRSLTRLSADIYWEQDGQYRFTSFSDTGPDWITSGTRRSIGKRRWEMPYLNMSAEDWVAHIALLDARKPFHDLELCRLNEAGDRVWVSVSGEPVFEASGTFQGYRGVGKDISARKRDEQALRLELAVTRILDETENVSAALKAVLQTLCEAQGWNAGRYLCVDEQANVLRFLESWSISTPEVERYIDHSRQMVYSPGVGMVGRVWQSGAPLWVADVTQDKRVARSKLLMETGMRGSFAIPVSAEGKTIGVLIFTSHEIREPDERLLRAVNVICSQIGQFVQRKQAEELLRESEERFRSLTQLSSDWYWEQDDQFRFTFFSGSPAEERSGIAATSYLGKTRWELADNHTEESWARHKAMLARHEPFHDFEVSRIGPDGQRRWNLTSGAPIFDADGRFKGYRGVGKDVTERKRAEQLLRLEHSVTRTLAGSDNVSTAMKAMMRMVCETEGWECGRYFRVDTEAGVMRFAEGWGVPNEAIQGFIAGSRDLTYAPGAGVMGQVWQSGQAMWVSDISSDPRVSRSALARDAGIHGTFVFPVLSDGKMIGGLAFNSREIREPDERLMQAIQIIGSQIGQYVRRKQTDEDLVRFRAAMDASADLVLLIDRASLRYIDVNQAACRALGYGREEFLKLGPPDIFSMSREKFVQLYDRMFAGELVAPTNRGAYRCKDGSLLAVEAFPRAVRTDSGDIVVTVARDIRERLAAEETLRRFRLAMDSSADMIVLIERATMRFVDVNETSCRLLGYSREELLQMGPQDVLPESRDELERSYDEFIADPSHTTGLKSTYRRKDGSTFPFESTRHVLRSGEGYIIAAISRDIRERLASETALKESNERFDMAVRATHDVIWDRNLLTDEVWWNENYAEVYGRGQDAKLRGRPWREGLHPEDRERVLAGIDSVIESGREDWSDEYRIRCGDGSYAQVFDRGHIIRDGSGRAVRMIGAMADLTARSAAEAKARNQALEQLVAERTAELEGTTKELEAFSYSVSHDLRAPLRHIDGFAKLVLERAHGVDETTERYLGTISKAAGKMGRLIDDLLAFSRTGRAELRTQSVDLSALVREVREECMRDATGRAITWKISELPRVVGDPSLLRIALVNLFSNAVKFTAKREDALIEVGARPGERGEVIVCVKDNGAGYDPRYADKLFGVFQRLHRESEFDGTGIGLATVRRIVTRHGGRVWAEGKIGSGASFYMTLKDNGANR